MSKLKRLNAQAVLAPIAIVLLLCGLPRESLADMGLNEGQAPHALMLVPSLHSDPSGSFQLRVICNSYGWQHPGHAVIRVHIRGGAELIQGDTIWSFEIVRKSSESKQLALRFTESGTARVSAELRFNRDGPNNYDVIGQAVEFDYMDGNLRLVANRATMGLSVRKGRRFRYGGRYMIALDQGETGELPQVESIPRLIRGGKIACKACPGLRDSVLLRVVVTVGRRGRVTWVRPGPVRGGPLSPGVWDAVLRGLGKYRFKPAMTPQGPVSCDAVLPVWVVHLG